MTVTLTFPPEVARLLEEKALRSGTTLEAYLGALAEKDARANDGANAILPDLPAGEVDRLLDELASGPVLPRLPLDLSRADFYADHD